MRVVKCHARRIAALWRKEVFGNEYAVFSVLSTYTMASRSASIPPAEVSAFSAAPAASSTAQHSTCAPASLHLPALQATSPATLAVRAEQLPDYASGALVALAAMPRVRGILLREGCEAKWDRLVNQEAALGHTRGQERKAVCNSFRRGTGPFTACINVPEHFSGSFANCYHGSERGRCSLRPSK
jgi:hypothetical protein